MLEGEMPEEGFFFYNKYVQDSMETESWVSSS